MAIDKFLIADMRHGIEEGVEPFLLPRDAWQKLENGYLRRGVLRKRMGYSLFCNQTDGGQLSRPVVGIMTYMQTELNQLPTVIMLDTKRAYEYDHETGEFIDISRTSATGATEDIWAGAPDNLFVGCNAENFLFVTNNHDPIKAWGRHGSDTAAHWKGIATNTIKKCRHIFFHKRRLLALDVVDELDGNHYPRRVRWSTPWAGTTVSWNHPTNSGAMDAPTADQISAAAQLGDDIIVWFRYSLWRLKYTNDAFQPFRWERIDASKGSHAPFSGFTHDNVMGAVGGTGIFATDTLATKRIDGRIPDAVSKFNQSRFDSVFSFPLHDKEQVLISYPKIGSTQNNASLCYNYRDGSWSRYSYGFTTYGAAHRFDELLRWNSKPGPDGDPRGINFRDMIRLNDGTLQAGYPTVLAGDSSGNVWQIDSGLNDAGESIDFYALSARINPYLEANRQAWLHQLDLLVDHSPGATYHIDWHAQIGNRNTLVKTDSVTLADEMRANKIWITVFCGAVGDFHQIGIRNNDLKGLVGVHAMRMHIERV